ncbi:cysteine hydrolase family protein [Streptomyces sp. NPDC052023]|uniref:cysteine hydrolase family protein n=1 Tax=Streptomyces sp. NPDC052023 TaxID=3365681 RepID=UPI0037CE7B2F
MHLHPRRTALVAVHMQRDIVSEGGAFSSLFAEQAAVRDVVGHIAALADAARSSGALVVHTRIAWRPGYTDMVANAPLLDLVQRNKRLTDGSPEAAIVPELAPREEDPVITHQRVSGFVATPLDAVLRGRGITTVVLAGVATNGSVESNARSACDLGYRTVVVSDACSTTDEAAHEASIASLRLFGEIATTHEVTHALETAAATAATAPAPVVA